MKTTRTPKAPKTPLPKQQIFLYIPYAVYPLINDGGMKELIEVELYNLITPLIKISPVKINLPIADDFSISFFVKDKITEKIFYDIQTCFAVYLKNDKDFSMYCKIDKDIIYRKLKSMTAKQGNPDGKVSFINDD
jgi:hypothetical protein